MAGKKPSRSVEGTEKVWGLKEIEQLIDVLIDRQVTEFEMEQGGAKIRVKRGNHPVSNSVAPEAYLSTSGAPTLSPVPASPSPAAPEPLPVAESLTAETPAESTEDLHVMKSPIVGTFYAAPAPNAPPFAQVGDMVQLGQVLCIIEAMKLMNELESEVAGEIVRIYVESGQPVEYGQSLFAIKPSRKK
ncbi:MAG: acetyl-CoA carboxylase biotin carboxyl carrier protein [Terriglobia bacterium]|jgi:acetyl-CoA carboxylase biotin carboxyl carrier protein